MKQFTLSKSERLSSRKDIESLFAEGQSLTKYPIRLVWRETLAPLSAETPIQVMFSVSKKKFSRAVDRNRVKRLMRESYRLLKPILYSSIVSQKSYHLGWIYTANEIHDFETIQKSISSALDKWNKKCHQD